MSRYDYYIMVNASREQGKLFKGWCRSQGLSMNRAFILFMKMAVSGDFIFKQSLKKKK